ncbi:MAG: hypothetical protein JO257_30545 [Deltaproteobacteria bacterium]|nr:hypothetical protein [Deltaproteobacteria bacterium]
MRSPLRWPVRATLASLLGVLAGCRAAHPVAPAATPLTVEVGGPLRGLAGDGESLVASVGTRVTSRGAHVWSVELASAANQPPANQPPANPTPGALAIGDGLVYTAASAKLRGDPGALVIALDAATGAERWRLPIDATGWSLITGVVPMTGGGVIVGGAFAGTLRAVNTVVTSAGQTDGFVARVSKDGSLAWLVRLGGPGADSVQGVAVRGSTIAIAGNFSPAADILGEPLASVDDELPFSDAFAATLDGSGKRTWSATYGGKLDDVVAGVAIDDSDRVVVAGTARDVVHVGAQELTAKGTDAIVVWFAPSGSAGRTGTARLIGGADLDGASAIVAAGDHVLVGGYAGNAGFIAELASDEQIAEWQATGPGREEVPALASVPGGFAAALAHTAALTFDGATLPAPADPAAGGALVVRPLR